jgi:exonuclease SbcC
MIERLTLSNFQAHKKLQIEFDPGVTSIVGSTDVGKSAVIRALSWLMRNTPNGLEFIRRGAKKAVAALTVDGKTIKRVRGASRNLYKLDGKVFKAFGAAVPDKISQLLQIGDLNFQAQHDAPFWFSDSSGAVSRKLNEIVSLGVIDAALSFFLAAVRKSKAEVEICGERIARARERKAELSFAPEFAADVERLEERQTKLEQIKEQCTNLEDLLLRARKLQRIAKIEIPDMTYLEELRDKTNITSEERAQLQTALASFSQQQKERIELQAELEELHKVYHDQYEGKDCPTCEGKGHL